MTRDFLKKHSSTFLWLAPVLVLAIEFVVQLFTMQALCFWRVFAVLVFDLAYFAPYFLRLRRKDRNYPGWLFAVATLLYCELMLQIWTYPHFAFERILVILLFDLCFGLLLSLLATIGKTAARCRVATLVIAGVFVALYFAEYIMWDAYDGAFMSLGIIISTAGAAMTGFDTYILGAIIGEFWRLCVMALPLVLYGVLGWKYGWGRVAKGVTRWLIAALGVVCFGGGHAAALLTPLSGSYQNAPFLKSVNTFGLLTAFRLDLFRMNKPVDDFLPETDVLETELAPTEVSEPAQTQPSETPTEPPEPGYNVMDIDFASLAAQEEDEELAKLHSYVASRQPTQKNDYTGLFEGKNLIFISAEALSREVIDPELTPALYRLATQGVEFTDYYQPAWGGSTSTGEYSNLIGLVPIGANNIQDTVGHNMYFTIANRLNALGYHSVGYHNNTYDYYHRDKTHPNLGYDPWIGMGNGMEQGVEDVWPQSDREMIDFTMDQYLGNQPFNVYYMSVSGHGLYSRDGNQMSEKNYAAVAELDYPETVKCYLAASLELEYALEDLLARLEQEGLLNDTVIVVAPDHYPYCLTKSTTWGNEEDYLEALYGHAVTNCVEQDHNCLILWSGCLEGKNLRVDTPVYSLDILPTLLNLFGIEYDSRMLVGRDVFSDAEPLVLWNDYSWKTEQGVYLYQTDEFLPADGVTVEDGYVERISNLVANRINYSRGVLKCDYFGELFGKLDGTEP